LFNEQLTLPCNELNAKSICCVILKRVAPVMEGGKYQIYGNYRLIATL